MPGNRRERRRMEREQIRSLRRDHVAAGMPAAEADATIRVYLRRRRAGLNLTDPEAWAAELAAEIQGVSERRGVSPADPGALPDLACPACP